MSRLLQVVIALVGLAITGLLGVSAERSENLQAKHALLALFSDSLAVARSTCDVDMTFVAQDALNRLERLETSSLAITPRDNEERRQNLESVAGYKDNLAAVQSTITAACAANLAAPAPIAQAPAPQTQSGGRVLAQAPDVAASVAAPAPTIANLELRQAESKQETVQDLPRARGYYAVLASYAVDDAKTYDRDLGVSRHYARLLAATRGAEGTLRLYRTRQSNHFAIVLATERPTRDAARNLVTIARANGWASDAFLQVDRDWQQCENPQNVRSADDCPLN